GACGAWVCAAGGGGAAAGGGGAGSFFFFLPQPKGRLNPAFSFVGRSVSGLVTSLMRFISSWIESWTESFAGVLSLLMPITLPGQAHYFGHFASTTVLCTCVIKILRSCIDVLQDDPAAPSC